MVRVSKVCVSDYDAGVLYEGQVGNLKANIPCGLCHACMGVVTGCGSKVTTVKPGDRVMLDAGKCCLRCSMCRRGFYNLCKNTNYFIPEDVHSGCLARYTKRKDHLVYKLPDCIGDEEGAVVEVLGLAVHACRRGEVRTGSSVLVTGAGPRGLLCAAVAKARGATNIMVVDVDKNRLKLARELGANHTLCLEAGNAQKQCQQVKQHMNCRPTISIECSGSSDGMSLCLYSTRSKGKVVQVGISNCDVKLPLSQACMREVDILGICCSVNCFREAMDMIANKLVDVTCFITNRFDFDDCRKAFEEHRNGRNALCCIVNCC